MLDRAARRRAGKPFDDEIAAALDNCRAMLLIFSEQCNGSEYIRREVTVAGENHKVIIPFRIEDVPPRRGLRVRLADLHWIDAFVSRDRAIDELAMRYGDTRSKNSAPATASEDGTSSKSATVLSPGTGTIDILLVDPGAAAYVAFLFGASTMQVHLLIDDAEIGSLKIGGATPFSVAQGSHSLRLVTKTVLRRKNITSPQLTVEVRAGETVRLAGKFSSFRGWFALSPVHI